MRIRPFGNRSVSVVLGVGSGAEVCVSVVKSVLIDVVDEHIMGDF